MSNENTETKPDTATETAAETAAQTATETVTKAVEPTKVEHPNGNVTDLSPLMAKLDAMPESIANAVREAMPSPVSEPTKKTETKSDDTKTDDTKTETKTATKAETPGRKSFTDWWFGK